MLRLFSLFLTVVFFVSLLFPFFCIAAIRQIEVICSPRERQIPVIAEVDVLVVGGTTGGVAAAVTAADHGAKTFLVAPYPYLGEDMTATLRLWLEPNETPTDPLAVAIYNDPNREITTTPNNKKSHNFSYKINNTINSKHPENKQNPRLSDKITNDPILQSLQIDGDATVIADLNEPKELAEIDLVAFLRNKDFQVNEVIYSASDDGQNWKILGNIKLPKNYIGNDKPVSYSLKLNPPIKTQYIKAEAKHAPETDRILLSELFLVPPQDKSNTKEPLDQTRPQFPPPRPLHVKKVLDDALLKSGVNFVYSSYATAVLVKEGTNHVCGVVINNRQGEQAVLAKTVIDASLYQNLSIAAADEKNAKEYHKFNDTFNRNKKTLPKYEFVVVGGEPQTFTDRFGLNGSPQVMGTYSGKFPNDAKTKSGIHKLIRYQITQSNKSQKIDNFESKLQIATYHPEQQEYADTTWHELSYDYSKLIPKTESNCRAVIFDQNTRPINLIEQGRKFGKQFAQTAKELPKINPAELRPYNSFQKHVSDSGGTHLGDEIPRPLQKTLVDLPMLTLQGSINFCCQDSDTILQSEEGYYDVIVVGGGTSGAPAAIAAGRQGAKVLLVEYLHGLGGVGTEGAIANYYWGNRVGFSAEVEDGKAAWVIEQRKQWWRKACVDANVKIKYGIMGIGAINSNYGNGNIIGIKTATENGTQYLFGKVIIDATGNGDIAFAAGAKPMYINANEIAVQGAGLPPKELGGRYRNTDYTFVDESDIFDSTHLFVYAKGKFPNAFDLSKILGTRERRRITGNYVLTVLDQINERTYPDTIVRARSNFDTHGYTISPYLEVEHPDRRGFYSYLPFRVNVPNNLSGILVSGLASSCERDAIPLMRMQPDLQNQGYALGYIAAISVKDNVPLREVNIRKVQKHLVQIGNLPASVLTDIDNYETLRAKLPEAVKNLPNSKTFDGAYRIFWYPEEGRKLAHEAFDKATDKEIKLCYAQVLAVMGDPVGVDLLIEKVRSYEKWDRGWNFRGMGQYGSALSPLDRLILALGRSGDKRAVPVIVEKLNQLTFTDDFSHYRACSLALEKLKDSSAAPAVAAALKKPDISGYVHRSIDVARKWDKADPKVDTGEKSRRDSLLEIGLARTLYRLGDQNNLGKSILTDYAENDLRGHFRQHARLVLGR
ncbi:MAG: FAD-dependent oxidoreductase [Planctomycetaceae bacterium]|jgi:ribulose 1,5-bisphosphate synthetase/thiazole synthase|nr:FAD-dependent oxidoreductase [Planctomycetaceae bacterium]